MFGDQIVDHLRAHITHDVGQIGCLHDVAALCKDHLALFVHHVIEFEQLFADVKVAAFNLGLRTFQRFVDPWVNDRLALFHAEARQHLVQPLGPEDAHQVVFQ